MGSQPINVLGTVHNVLQAEIIDHDINTNDITVKFTLFTTIDEANPSFSKTVVFPGTVNHAFSFNNTALLTAAKTALNL
jgi:hypothetical protein